MRPEQAGRRGRDLVTRRCFLHVGVPKTGTTHLQDVLWGSRQELRRQGFRLPMRSIEDHFHLTLALRGQLDPALDPPCALAVLKQFRADVRRSGSEHLLVSHELLAPVAENQVDELLDFLGGFEVHVVITARDLARQVPAEWQQRVKTRAHAPYPTFVDQVRSGRNRQFWSVQDVASVAERWGGRLPPERVHVVTLPPPGSSSDLLLSRFCQAVGLTADRLSRDRARTNESMGYEQTELLRRVNIALGDRLPHPRSGYSNVVKFGFAETVLARQGAGQRLRLPQEHAEWCVGVSKEMVVRLEDAGYAVHGDLADLVPVFAPSEDTPAPTEAEVAAAAASAIADMLDLEHRREVRLRRRRAARVGSAAGRLVRTFRV